jgi:hypothetical protein
MLDVEGHFATAYAKAIEKAGLNSAQVVRYGQTPGGGLPFMFGANAAAGSGGDINLLKVDAGSLAALPRSRFLYMWQPELTQANLEPSTE